MAQDKITIKGKEIDFIKELGIEDLPIEEQGKLIERMANVVNKRLILRILDHLSEQEVKLVNANLVSGDTEAAFKIMDEKVPNFDKIVSEELAKFQEEMLK
jgi:hypothetical protein